VPLFGAFLIRWSVSGSLEEGLADGEVAFDESVASVVFPADEIHRVYGRAS
jgi:hypothetical protein